MTFDHLLAMKHFGIFILFVVTFIQYGYGEGEEEAPATESVAEETKAEGENPTENKEEESQTECGCASEASETQSDTVITECETEQSATDNQNFKEASEGKEEGTCASEDVTTMEPQTPSLPDIGQEAIVPANAPPLLGVEKALHTWHSRVTTKPPDSPALCQRPLTPQWPIITRPSSFPSSKLQTQFSSHEYNFHHFQSQEQWSYTLDNQNNVNKPCWQSCTIRPLPEPPGSIIMRSRLSRGNNMNPPLWNSPLRDGCVNRMPMGYSCYRTPPTYFNPTYSNYNEMQRTLDVTSPWGRPQTHLECAPKPQENAKGKPGAATKIMNTVKDTMCKIKDKFTKKSDKKPQEPQPMLCGCCNRIYIETTTKKSLAKRLTFWKK